MGAHRIWTKDTIMAAVIAFVEREGYFPAYLDFRSVNHLPSHDSIDRYYSTPTEGGHTALRRAYVALAHPPQPHDAPNWCLRCGQVRLRRGVHVCARCRERPAASDGAWMSGQGVPEDFWDLADFDVMEG